MRKAELDIVDLGDRTIKFWAIEDEIEEFEGDIWNIIEKDISQDEKFKKTQKRQEKALNNIYAIITGN